MKAVLDSNILIDYLRGINKARIEIALYNEPLISPITWMEVMSGATDEEEKQLNRNFLDRFQRVELVLPVMEQAATLRNTHRLKLPDAIILASAQVNNLMLVTRNTKDFDPRKLPNVRVPYVI